VAGDYAYVTDLDVSHDVSVAPGGVLFLTSKLLALLRHPVDYASGTLGLGLAKIFFFST
jgi:hypothetical protein